MATLSATSALLISQWANSTRLKALLDVWLDVVRERVGEPLDEIQRQMNLDHASGIWLDWIGERLGLPRPSDENRAGDLFGFDEAGIGYNQGRFRDGGGFNVRAPIGDVLYRNLLRARAVTLLTPGGTLPDMERAVQFLDPFASVRDLHDMRFRVVTSVTRDVEVADRVRALPRPAGVQIVIVDRGKWGFDSAGLPFDQGGFA